MAAYATYMLSNMLCSSHEQALLVDIRYCRVHVTVVRLSIGTVY